MGSPASRRDPLVPPAGGQNRPQNFALLNRTHDSKLEIFWALREWRGRGRCPRTTVGCLRCGVWYDPARPHVCGVVGDDTARRLEARIDALEQRVQGLELEAHSRFKRARGAMGPTRMRPAAKFLVSASFDRGKRRPRLTMSRRSPSSPGRPSIVRRIMPPTCAAGGCARRCAEATFAREPESEGQFDQLIGA
jgi:hypothetical protein